MDPHARACDLHARACDLHARACDLHARACDLGCGTYDADGDETGHEYDLGATWLN